MKTQLVLAIDTCGATGSVAIAWIDENATVTVAYAELAGRTCASLLVPRISEILDEAFAQLHEMAAIAVVTGPGSFTGVRVGVAAAKALAEATGKPLIGISRLAVLCRQAQLEEICCCLLDAGRGEFYAGLYHGTECIQERLMTREQVLAASGGAVLVTAEPAVAAAFPNARVLGVEMPSVIHGLPLAVARLLSGDYDDAASLDGNYLRRTDSELFAKPQPRAVRDRAQ